jgi:hypothetical protein
MTDNLRHWNALGRTDPAHTKGFQRAGGFRGTAIKPIWTELRMTEQFGPCGVGWGMDKPEFQLVPIDGNGELLVFCTVRLWYVDPDGNGTVGTVYGVGGDKVITRRSSGLATSDEAFKACFTDALSNAMKHVGVGADVHMGLFDDSKYVREASEAFRAAAPDKIAAKAPAGAQEALNARLGTSGLREKLEASAALTEDLKAKAYDAAHFGTGHLKLFWSALTADEKRDLKPFLDRDLKGIAEVADVEQFPPGGPIEHPTSAPSALDGAA